MSIPNQKQTKTLLFCADTLKSRSLFLGYVQTRIRSSNSQLISSANGESVKETPNNYSKELHQTISKRLLGSAGKAIASRKQRRQQQHISLQHVFEMIPKESSMIFFTEQDPTIATTSTSTTITTTTTTTSLSPTISASSSNINFSSAKLYDIESKAISQTLNSLDIQIKFVGGSLISLQEAMFIGLCVRNIQLVIELPLSEPEPPLSLPARTVKRSASSIQSGGGGVESHGEAKLKSLKEVLVSELTDMKATLLNLLSQLKTSTNQNEANLIVRRIELLLKVFFFFFFFFFLIIFQFLILLFKKIIREISVIVEETISASPTIITTTTSNQTKQLSTPSSTPTPISSTVKTQSNLDVSTIFSKLEFIQKELSRATTTTTTSSITKVEILTWAKLAHNLLKILDNPNPSSVDPSVMVVRRGTISTNVDITANLTQLCESTLSVYKNLEARLRKLTINNNSSLDTLLLIQKIVEQSQF